MLQVATVFSGIGAIEQALLRKNIGFEIKFACDNGNVKINNIDIEVEKKHIFNLKNAEEKMKYVDELYSKRSRQTNFVKKSYLANYETKYFYQDIMLLDGKDWHNQVDLLVGGSPCQSFSIIGKKAGLDDTRGTLFYEYARLVREIQPKVFIFENVYGLYKHDKGNTWKVIQDVFNSLGYKITHNIMDAKSYGIPQGRRRLFVVGFHTTYENNFQKFKFPEPFELDENKMMQYYLEDHIADGDLIINEKGILTKKSDGKPGKVAERYFLSEKLKAYCLSPGTKNFYHPNAKIDLPIARALLSTMGNRHRSSVNNYVTTDQRVRALSVREAHRLMGFPDSYKIVVSVAQAYKQAGNSIVVDVLMHLLTGIYQTGIFDEMD